MKRRRRLPVMSSNPKHEFQKCGDLAWDESPKSIWAHAGLLSSQSKGKDHGAGQAILDVFVPVSAVFAPVVFAPVVFAPVVFAGCALPSVLPSLLPLPLEPPPCTLRSESSSLLVLEVFSPRVVAASASRRYFVRVA